MPEKPPVLIVTCSNNHARREVARIVARGVYKSAKRTPELIVTDGVGSYEHYPKVIEDACEVNTPETPEPTGGNRTYTLVCRSCNKAASGKPIQTLKIRESNAQALYEKMRHAGQNRIDLGTLRATMRR